MYTYTFLALFFLAIWGALYVWRKDVRREMIQIGLIFAIAGPVSEYFYFQDYWQPETLSGSFLSLESIVFGFALGGGWLQ